MSDHAEQAEPERAEPERAEPGQAEPGQAEPEQTERGQAHAEQHSAQPVEPRRRLIAPVSLVIAFVVAVLDQLTKHWAVNALADGAAHHVVGSLQWNLAYNSGMAFSRATGIGPLIGLVAFAVVVGLALTSSRLGSRVAEVAAGLLIGGALGNLLDRLFRGQGWLRGSVVDFIDLQWWPIFNVADIAVTVGAVVFALSALFQPARQGAPK